MLVEIKKGINIDTELTFEEQTGEAKAYVESLLDNPIITTIVEGTARKPIVRNIDLGLSIYFKETRRYKNSETNALEFREITIENK